MLCYCHAEYQKSIQYKGQNAEKKEGESQAMGEHGACFSRVHDHCRSVFCHYGWFEKSDPNVRPGEGRIVGAVLIVGAAIVAFLP